jgi:hypothetical protein
MFYKISGYKEKATETVSIETRSLEDKKFLISRFTVVMKDILFL